MKKKRAFIRFIIELFPLLVLILAVFRTGEFNFEIQLGYLDSFKFEPFYDLLASAYNSFGIELTLGIDFLFIMLSWLLVCMIFELIYLFFDFICNIFERKGAKM